MACCFENVMSSKNQDIQQEFNFHYLGWTALKLQAGKIKE
jgi:hypothetical protein